MHQRDVTRTLLKNKIDNPKSFEWLCQMRFYFDPKQTEVLQQLSIQMANAKFNYGFEYLGVQDKLVQTPLTDRCYLTMTQALEARLGGSPFGMRIDLSTPSFYLFLNKVATPFNKTFFSFSFSRTCWHRKDRVGEGAWSPTWSLRPCLQL